MKELPPALSVVIPTHQRETRLAIALDSLAGESSYKGAFEVIVVRSPEAEDPLAEWPAGLRGTQIVSAERGAAAQRNAGWKAASAPVVAFIDDDCRVAPGWVGAVLRATRSQNDDGRSWVIVQGRTEPDPDEDHLLFGLARSIRITEMTGLYETCNLTYPKALLERLEGFDPKFVAPWGEDVDLGLRAVSAGAESVYIDDALVWHAVHSLTLPKAVADTRRRSQFAAVLSRHPHVRSRIVGGIFVNEAHAAVAVGIVAGAAGMVARRRRYAMLAAIPYVAVALKHEFQRGRPTVRSLARLGAHLPVRAIVDLAEATWVVRGAVQERTLVV